MRKLYYQEYREGLVNVHIVECEDDLAVVFFKELDTQDFPRTCGLNDESYLDES